MRPTFECKSCGSETKKLADKTVETENGHSEAYECEDCGAVGHARFDSDGILMDTSNLVMK
jgi:uncharacterized Zn finger protein